jgi:hypothetical protein
LDLREADVTAIAESLPQFDIVIASGVFNARLKAGDNLTHISQAVRAMLQLARRYVAVDFLSSHVDFQKEEAWHTDPAWALNFARQISRRFLLRHDYMPYEFAVFIFRDGSISPRNVFSDYEKILRK